MIKNGNNYDKFYRNGKLYGKGFFNGIQILKSQPNPALILDIDFQNDYENNVFGGLQMEASGSSPTFVSGRNGNDFAAYFNGLQSIKTIAPLDLQSDKVSVAFWIKTSQNNVGIVCELSEEVDSNNAFFIAFNHIAPDYFTLRDGIGGDISQNILQKGTDWFHIVAVIDRTDFNKICKIYINGVENSEIIQQSFNYHGNFSSNIFYIGQRAGYSLGFIGAVQDFKVYKKALTQQEITTLYNY